jgi:hypothetical protein
MQQNPILRHGREFGQHFVDKMVDIGKRIPRPGRRFGRTDGGSHVLAPMLMIANGLDGRLFRHCTQFNAGLLSRSR